MRRIVVGLAIAVATLTPVGALANDQQIAQQIIQKLEQQKQAGQLKGFGIDLQVDDGTVFMTGKVATPEQQQLALGIAQRTPGVKQVVNGLEVSGGAEAKGGLMSGLGSSVKKAFGRQDEGPEAQQVANIEAVTQQQSVVKKTAPVKAVPSYVEETGSGVKAISATPRVQQSQLVAAQQPMYAPPVPAPQPNMAPRTLQSQLEASNPVARATMPGHMGPARVAQTPVAMNGVYPASYGAPGHVPAGAIAPMPYGGAPAMLPGGVGIAPARYDHPYMPGYAWPSYASYPNYAAVTYPKQYSPTAWPYIGPFYPYPQVPLGWRKVCLEWDDGWWMLDFKDQNRAWKHHR